MTTDILEIGDRRRSQTAATARQISGFNCKFFDMVNSELIENLVAANRILAQQGILDGFGHVSVRHDSDPNRFLRRVRSHQNHRSRLRISWNLISTKSHRCQAEDHTERSFIARSTRRGLREGGITTAYRHIPLSCL
jgi:hypothetical protein